MEDLPKLPYTEMVIRESMRLYPPAPGFAREPTEDVTVGGWDLPKCCLVVVNAYALHHDARFFPEPERFDPERFSKGWEERMSRVCVFTVWRGAPRAHWEWIRDDGSAAGSCNDSAEVAADAGTGGGDCAGAVGGTAAGKTGADATGTAIAMNLV